MTFFQFRKGCLEFEKDCTGLQRILHGAGCLPMFQACVNGGVYVSVSKLGDSLLYMLRRQEVM